MPVAGRPAKPSPRVVIASDGTRLHAEVQGDPDAPVTVVLCHGYLFNSASWRHQRAVLARHARVVTWDHRGHGRSARGALARLTIDQLGRDLLAVVQQTAGRQPLVLVGHSMGGMAIMALAEQHPELFGTRVSGTALLTSAAGPLRPGLGLSAAAATSLVQAGQQTLSLARRMVLATTAIAAVRRVQDWISRRCSPRLQLPESTPVGAAQATPLEVVLGLVPEFLHLDKTAGLAALGKTDALILGVTDDTVTGPDHSTAIAEAVPGARLVMLGGGGHNAHHDHPNRVNHHLRALLSRVIAAAAAQDLPVRPTRLPASAAS